MSSGADPTPRLPRGIACSLWGHVLSRPAVHPRPGSRRRDCGRGRCATGRHDSDVRDALSHPRRGPSLPVQRERFRARACLRAQPATAAHSFPCRYGGLLGSGVPVIVPELGGLGFSFTDLLDPLGLFSSHGPQPSHDFQAFAQAKQAGTTEPNPCVGSQCAPPCPTGMMRNPQLASDFITYGLQAQGQWKFNVVMDPTCVPAPPELIRQQAGLAPASASTAAAPAPACFLRVAGHKYKCTASGFRRAQRHAMQLQRPHVMLHIGSHVVPIRVCAGGAPSAGTVAPTSCPPGYALSYDAFRRLQCFPYGGGAPVAPSTSSVRHRRQRHIRGRRRYQ
jgi:hypothetical protein